MKRKGSWKLGALAQMFDERDIFLLQSAVGFVPAWEIGAHPQWRLDSHLHQSFYRLDHEQVDREHVAKGGGWPRLLDTALYLHHCITIREMAIQEIVHLLVKVFPGGMA